jgi:hypothetical protein
MAPMGFSGARGNCLMKKNLKSNISCQTPFNAGRLKSRETFNTKFLKLSVIAF